MSFRKKEKKRNRLAAALDVPAECFFDVPVLELHGDSYLLIAGCRHIEEYGRELIAIRTGIGLLSAFGKNLTLINFTSDKIAIEGTICRLEFTGAGT